MTDEVWDSIVESFADDSAAAFILAQVLCDFKDGIKKGSGSAVVKDLERGIEKLYPYTDDYRAALKLYQLSVAGKLKPKHDPTLIVKDL
ncbi:MAG TPA: hypothetical protein VNG71_20045 [Pyrinomonadaceae bacterium]|nr:hypothetical protein [Pyrinomonadaceae bacterium]